jgi:hypothetical protein
MGVSTGVPAEDSEIRLRFGSGSLTLRRGGASKIGEDVLYIFMSWIALKDGERGSAFFSGFYQIGLLDSSGLEFDMI